MTEVRGNIHYGHEKGFFFLRKLKDSEKQRLKKPKMTIEQEEKRSKMC